MAQTHKTHMMGRKRGTHMPSRQTKHPDVSYTDIRPGKYAIVKGTITWCRAATPIDGDELKEKIERQRRQNRMNIIEEPHIAISIDNAQVVGPHDPNDPSKIADSGTVEQKYLDNRLFQTRQDPNARYSYSGERFSHEERIRNGNLIPMFRLGDASKGEDPKAFYQFFPKADLARGTKVALVMRAYAGRMNNNGMGLQAILVRDPDVKYIGSAGFTAALKKDLMDNFNITIELSDEEPEAPIHPTNDAPTDIPGIKTVAAPKQVVEMPEPVAPVIDDPGMSGIDMAEEKDVKPGVTVDDFDPNDLYT